MAQNSNGSRAGKFDPKHVIFTPQEVADIGLNNIEHVHKHIERALPLNISPINAYFAPTFPGQLISVIAQTSNYKTAFLHAIERYAAQYLSENGRKDEVIIHVSVEDCVDEQAQQLIAYRSGYSANKLARGHIQDWKKVYDAAVEIAGIPIYRIGDSLARPGEYQRLTLTNMMNAVKHLVDGHVTGEPLKLAGLFFDYLQAFPIDTEARRVEYSQQRRLQVREDLYRLRHASVYFNCPVWVAVQAKQSIRVRNKLQIPAIYDGEESSSIAQRSDKVLQLCMPKTIYSAGTPIKEGAFNFIVQDNLLLIENGKQRGGLPAGRIWLCELDFYRNEIIPIQDSDGHVYRK